MTLAALPSSAESREALSYWSPAETRVAEEGLPLLRQGRGEVVPAPKEMAQESRYSSVTVEFKGGEERRRGEGVVVKGQVPFRIRSGDSQ